MKKRFLIFLILNFFIFNNLYCYSNERTIKKPHASTFNRAVKKGNIEKVDAYLKAGFDPNTTYWTTWMLYGTPIIGTAISSKQNEILDLLLKNGASANPKSIVPPLHVAVICKNPYAVDKLLQAGANTENTYMGMTAENFAITKNYTDIVAVFLKHKDQKKHNKKTTTNLSVAGIGVQLYKDGNKTFIINVIPNSPAYNAYLSVGAQILEIDSKKIKNLSVDQVAELIRGESGTRVTLLAKSNGRKNMYTMKREPIIQPKNVTNKIFDIHWRQIVPEQYANVVYYEIMPQYSNNLKNEMSVGNYWVNRKRAFKNGYDACMTYKKDEQNSCLMNLVNREIARTEQDRQMEMQEIMYRQQATQNFINNMNQIQTNMNLNNINNSIQQQNMHIQNTNMQLFNINNSLNRW